LFTRLRPSLGNAQAYYDAQGTLTRLQVGPFASMAEGTRVCARLKPQPCFALDAD
jgi:cell division septation protein DedD